MPDKVFHRWRRDRSNKTYRGVNEDALTQAMRNLGRERNEIYAPLRAIWNSTRTRKASPAACRRGGWIALCLPKGVQHAKRFGEIEIELPGAETNFDDEDMEEQWWSGV
ncbi:MAG: hypothetical protein OXB95_01010 [Rhodobacteraceae bacterium]|nr:hypothetical protein [Paracoccaceae bacterium]